MSWGEETGRVKVPVNAEMWTTIHAQGLDPPTEIGRRGLDVLRMEYGCEEDEVEFIGKDALYANSCRTEYWQAKRTFDRHRKLPRKMVLEFNRPGTRTAGMKPRPGEQGQQDG